MTARRRRTLFIGVYAALAVAGFVLSWRWSANRLPGADAASQKTYEGARRVLIDVREQREKKPDREARFSAVVNRTLGGTLGVVDSALRTRLNRLGESEKVRELAVGTGANSMRESPARAKYGRSADQRSLRDEADFVELQGWISGEGSVVQILRLLLRIDAEPWLKRIDSLRFEAIRGDKPGAAPRLKTTIRLTTIFVPRREPTDPLLATWSDAAVERVTPLVAASLFALPAPPEAQQPVVVAAPPPPQTPPSFAYDEWLVVGVAQGPAGPEAWLSNRRTNERRVLALGERLHEMTLSDASGEVATFTLGEQRYAIAVGRSLNDRSPIGQ